MLKGAACLDYSLLTTTEAVANTYESRIRNGPTQIDTLSYFCVRAGKARYILLLLGANHSARILSTRRLARDEPSTYGILENIQFSTPNCTVPAMTVATILGRRSAMTTRIE